MISPLTKAMHFILPASLPRLKYFALIEHSSPTESQAREFTELVHRAAPYIDQSVPFLCTSVYHNVFSPIIVEVPLCCTRCGVFLEERCYECLDNSCDECGDPYCDDCSLHTCKDEECGKRGKNGLN
jgi:hypothetical protein